VTSWPLRLVTSLTYALHGTLVAVNKAKSILHTASTPVSLGTDTFVARNAVVSGNVTIGNNSSVFYGTVVRGERAPITIGDNTNVQDGCSIHTCSSTVENASTDHPVSIGSNVTIGHQCSLHGCTIEDGALIGMGATVLEGAVVEEGAMVAAGAVVERGSRVKKGEIYGGNPAKMLRKLKEEERAWLVGSADAYVAVAKEHKVRGGMTVLDIAREKGFVA
jgi:carbonic anhydrase/acetyltransferase-like protein (isoleucine patch superfamily)